MAAKTPKAKALRALGWLSAIIVIFAAIIGVGVATDKTTGVPLLALDLEGGTQMVLSPETVDGGNITDEQMNQAVEIIRARVDGSGVSEAEIATQGNNNVVVSLPGTPDERTRELIQASANMEFRPVIFGGDPGVAFEEDQRFDSSQFDQGGAEPENASDLAWITPNLADEYQDLDCSLQTEDSALAPADPEKPMVACDTDYGVKYILGPVEVSGTDISGAEQALSSTPTGVSTNSWVVNISFDKEGTESFREVTQRITSMPSPQNQFAIVLDGEIVSAPSSNAVITNGRAEISGNFTEESSRALAEQLQYGALPISFSIESEQQISATLGKNQLFWGLMAGLIGLGLVAIYQFYQYRALGLVTLSSLVVAGILTYEAIVLLGWSDNYRLSLAGIAGIIVAIGLTADSFIVYFERIKDEMRAGRPFTQAVERGWDRAKRTITASKAVNILASIVLYIVAVGNVRGFAFTLGLTAIADLIVVFMFTHPVMQLLSRTKFFGEGHPLSGMDPSLLGHEPLYKGAGRVREFRSTEEIQRSTKKKNAGASKEAARRQTIAERRRAQEKASEDVGQE